MWTEPQATLWWMERIRCLTSDRLSKTICTQKRKIGQMIERWERNLLFVGLISKEVDNIHGIGYFFSLTAVWNEYIPYLAQIPR